MKKIMFCIILAWSLNLFTSTLIVFLEDTTIACPIFINGGFVKTIKSDSLKIEDLEPTNYKVSIISENYFEREEFVRQYFAGEEILINELLSNKDNSFDELISKTTYNIYLLKGEKKEIMITNKMLGAKKNKFTTSYYVQTCITVPILLIIGIIVLSKLVF